MFIDAHKHYFNKPFDYSDKIKSEYKKAILSLIKIRIELDRSPFDSELTEDELNQHAEENFEWYLSN